MTRPNTVEMFWSLVDKSDPDGCWLWRGSKNVGGYGEFSFEGRIRRAHRLAYKLHHGTLPPGLFVCHHCDNPICVRPSRLFLGTALDNSRDCKAKGRLRPGIRPPGTGALGERHRAAKITEKEVRAIRQLRAEGWKFKQIAEKFPLHVATLSQICKRRLWKHVE